MQIIPAIDIIDGKCVRLTQGDYSKKKIYNENPLEVAKEFEEAGIKRLHLVDLDGAKAGRIVNWNVLEQLASGTELTIDFGGGIKKEEDLKIIFDSGGDIATIGSMTVKEPETVCAWLDQYGGDKILIGADVKGELLAIHGWTTQTDVNIFDFLQFYMSKGLTQAFCTDISRDGAFKGPSMRLYKKILEKFPTLRFVASGGVTTTKDLIDLRRIGCSGVIIGKALYEGRIKLEDISLNHLLK